MTVTNTNVATEYPGNDLQVLFPITFDFEATNEIVVELDGVEQTYGASNDYIYASLVGGLPTQIQMNTAPATGETLTVKRNKSIQQNTAFADSDPTPLEEFERGLDRLTRRMQEVDYNQEQQVTAPTSVSPLAIPDPEANKYLGWNSGATALENKEIDLTTLQADIGTLQSQVAILQAQVVDLLAQDAVHTAAIAANTANISSNATNIGTNTADIASNDVDIAALQVSSADYLARIQVLENYFGTVSQQSILNNQGVGVDITDFTFEGNDYDSILIDYNIIRTTDTNYKGEAGTLHCIYKGDGIWYLENGLQTIDIAGVTFTISTGPDDTGQISYTSDDLAGTGYSGKINYRVIKFEA